MLRTSRTRDRRYGDISSHSTHNAVRVAGVRMLRKGVGKILPQTAREQAVFPTHQRLGKSSIHSTARKNTWHPHGCGKRHIDDSNRVYDSGKNCRRDNRGCRFLVSPLASIEKKNIAYRRKFYGGIFLLQYVHVHGFDLYARQIGIL